LAGKAFSHPNRLRSRLHSAAGVIPLLVFSLIARFVVHIEPLAMVRLRKRIFASSLALLFLVIFSTSAPFAAASEPAPSSSPSAHVDLICHTDDPKDCYPRVFQPTDEFQIVHDDQDLPSGLHVRLNIWTGQKEAKINDPTEADPALEGLPIDRSIVVVDRGEAQEVKLPRGAPAYDPVGKIKEPLTEDESFQDALLTLKNGREAAYQGSFDQSLESLRDLSHDVYYGLKIAEDGDALKSLLCLMTERNSQTSLDGIIAHDQQAAGIVGGALQNNQKALEEVTKKWTSLMGTTCQGNGLTLKERIFSSLIPSEAIPTTQRAAAKVRTQVSAINHLIKSPTIRDDFIANDGMSRLLAVLIPTTEEWAPAQKQVGQLLLDNFLDEDWGATTGIFPRKAALPAATCGKAEYQTDEGCWGYHVGRIMKRNEHDSSHWSKDVDNRLRAAIRVREGTAHKTERLEKEEL
jgi:nucleotide exchange factor SIL1